jgi:hypothetical protein
MQRRVGFLVSVTLLLAASAGHEREPRTRPELWGGPAQLAMRQGHAVAAVQIATFSYLIHTSTIAAELQHLERPAE